MAEEIEIRSLMGGSKISKSLMGFAVMAVMLEISISVKADTLDCTQNLIPCSNYLNSSNPPASCCNPLKQAVATQLACLCSFYTNPDLLKTFGVNLTQALHLGSACGVPVDINNCKTAASSPQSLPPGPATGTGNVKNGGGRLTWTGAFTLVVIWTSMVVYSSSESPTTS